MAGSLTIGGMADGLLIGKVTIGPSTMTGAEAISEVINLELVANVDSVVKVPPGATAVAVIFTFAATSAAELKLGSNLCATATGFPVPAEGWLCLPLTSETTELKFKSAAAPAVFQLVFI